MRTNFARLGPVSIQTNPTFDIAPLDTKNFAEGINEPVSLNLLWYYLQRIGPSFIMPLFVSRIELAEISVRSDGTKTVLSVVKQPGDQRSKQLTAWTAPMRVVPGSTRGGEAH
jgi:hypothetical protein